MACMQIKTNVGFSVLAISIIGKFYYIICSVLYIAPGVTTYQQLNPSFRLYTIDSGSYELIDHDTYYMDLVEANKNGPTKDPEWKHEYSAKVFNIDMVCIFNL